MSCQIPLDTSGRKDGLTTTLNGRQRGEVMSNEHVADLSKDTIIAEAQVGSAGARGRLDVHSRVLEAKEQGDVERLYAGYREAVEDRAKLESALMRSFSLMAEHDTNRLPNESGIAAIRDVALAAISLAHAVATSRASPDK